MTKAEQGAMIRRRRVALKLPLHVVAQALGWSPKNLVSQIERGTGGSPQQVEALCNLLGLSYEPAP